MDKQTKLIKGVNLAYFLALVFFALYFGKERALFCDSSMQLYDMAFTRLPRVTLSMLATIFNFILPYAAILLGLPAKAVVYALALNYLLPAVATFIFLRYRQASLRYEWAFLLTFTLFNAQTYYFPIHDYWSGFYLLFILYRVVDDPSLGWTERTRAVSEYLLIAALFFTHLSIVIALGFFYLYLFLDRRVEFRRLVRLYGYMLFLFVFKVLLVNSDYQNNLIDPEKLLSGGLSGLFSNVTMNEFVPTLLKQNINAVLMALLATVMALVGRRYLTLLLAGIVVATSLFIINLMFPTYGYSVYTEGYLKSTNIVSGIIFSEFLFTGIRRAEVKAAVATVLFSLSVFTLLQGGQVFRRQYEFILAACDQFQGAVYLRSEKDICPLDCLVLPRQSMLISQIERSRKVCIFANVSHEPYVENLNQKWIEDNRTHPVKNFVFTGPVRYLDADSLGFPLERYSVLFAGKSCQEMTRRLAGN